MLTQIQQSVTCQICLDLMVKPYALAPCGHLACYSCLVRWFTSEPAHGAAPPEHLRKKICPQCRAVIKNPPVEVWGVKSIVSGLSKSGLLEGHKMPAKNDAHENENGSTDPWSKIFKRNPNRNADHDFNPDVGYHDVEDGVFRCMDCFHEIWDGVCSSCGRVYRNIEVDDVDPVDDYDDEDDHVGHVAWFNPWPNFWPWPNPWQAPNFEHHENHYHDHEHDRRSDHDHYETYSDIDQEEEDGYESSFIDDEIDENWSNLHGLPRAEREGANETSNAVEQVDEEDEEDEEESIGRIRRGLLRARTAASRARPVVVSTDGEEEEEEEEPVGQNSRRRLRAGRVANMSRIRPVVTSSDGESAESDGDDEPATNVGECTSSEGCVCP
jgi:hypothetical protein